MTYINNFVPNKILFLQTENMWNSYLHLVTNDDRHQFETNHAFNTLLYNIAWAITDIYSTVKPFDVWLHWEMISYS